MHIHIVSIYTHAYIIYIHLIIHIYVYRYILQKLTVTLGNALQIGKNHANLRENVG